MLGRAAGQPRHSSFPRMRESTADGSAVHRRCAGVAGLNRTSPLRCTSAGRTHRAARSSTRRPVVNAPLCECHHRPSREHTTPADEECTPMPSAVDSRVRGNDEGLVTPAWRRCTALPSAVDSRVRGNDEGLVTPAWRRCTALPSAVDSRIRGNDESWLAQMIPPAQLHDSGSLGRRVVLASQRK